MVLLVVPAIWQVPVGTGCHTCRDVWLVSQAMLILLVTGDVVMEDPWIRSELPTLQQAELFCLNRNQERFFCSEKKWLFPVLFSREILLSPKHSGGRKKTVQLSVDKDDIAQLVVRSSRGFGGLTAMENRIFIPVS